MCIIVTSEFYAPFNIYARKIIYINVHGDRFSEHRPNFRSGNLLYDNLGTYLKYDKNSIVESPGGPGIHMWYGKSPFDEHRIYKPTFIDLMIPRGAYVRYGYEFGLAGIVFAAFEVVVLS